MPKAIMIDSVPIAVFGTGPVTRETVTKVDQMLKSIDWTELLRPELEKIFSPAEVKSFRVGVETH